MISNFKNRATVGHVGIEVKSLERSKKFYEALLGTLGFRVIMDSKEGIGFSNEVLGVWLGMSIEPRVNRKAPTGDEFVVADHLAILVPDKNDVYNIEKEMIAIGFKPLFPCEEHPRFEPGYYAVSFCDPDNYVIEVYTRAKL